MLQRGAVLSGKYRIDSVLGEGGMAVVYAVTHLRNTARLAIKVLHADSVQKGHVRARFVREGKVANSVNHPGAVQMIDDGVTEDGSPYLVMEQLNGICIADLSARGLPLPAALNIAYQVLDVLRAAHSHGIIHRDIKPANLFVLRDGRVKVLDFGISRLHDGAEPFDSVATGSVMGTPFFMAPEQARADASEIDTRTDLFAVGATLFTLISGKYLHTGEEARQVMMQAATRQARSLATVAPRTPQAIVDLVAKAVAFERAARWDSAEAMQEAVRQVHEALCGPIGCEALAALVLGREFRLKSHTKLTSTQHVPPCTASSLEPSPLSTTLPAVAAVTRSRDSVDPARDSSPSGGTLSSRISAGPSELAGWTGHVPTNSDPKSGAATRTGSRWAHRLVTSRELRVGVLACALLFAAIFGIARFGTEARPAAAELPVNSEVAAPAALLVELADGDPELTNAVVSATPPDEAHGQLRSAPTAGARPSPNPLRKSPSGKQPGQELSTSVERLNVAPTLIRADRSER